MAGLSMGGQQPVMGQTHSLGGGMTAMMGGLSVGSVSAGPVSGGMPQPVAGPVTTSGLGTNNTTLATKLWQ
ncbi:hypothetical protein Hamer_G005164 [Homarus americanus]|uniref:Uncharacterized protein n=2 Tax=Homarus americanus TaxID=6706 RepID=A0A8J5MV42_HOMAM|nr:hypothetical protein Hamer_G005164 [Homarus americanus]